MMSFGFPTINRIERGGFLVMKFCTLILEYSLKYAIKIDIAKQNNAYVIELWE
jgi:hypothetical protein